MRAAPLPDAKFFPIDGNSVGSGDYGDCVVASTAHLFEIIFGVVVPVATVIKDFKGWCQSGGCTVGWFMWRLLISGLHGLRIRSFGSLKPTQSDMQYAIDRWKGAIVQIFDGAHQATLMGNVGDEGTIRLMIWGGSPNAPCTYQDLTWAQFLPMLYGSGHFAMSPGFDPMLLAFAAKNNWKWWIILPVIAGLTFDAAHVAGLF